MQHQITWTDVLELQQYCEAIDDVSLKLNWDMLENHRIDEGTHLFEIRDGKLIAFLGRYDIGGTIEVCGMVHPDYRRHGIFTHLLNKGLDDQAVVSKSSAILLNAPANSQTAKYFLHSISCQYEMSEYQMKYDAGYDQLYSFNRDVSLRHAIEDDTELLIQLDIDGFGESYTNAVAFYDGMSPTELYENEIVMLHDKPAGKLRISRVHGECWIYGFVVAASYRGQKIGSAVLRRVIDRETAAGCQHLKLEVAVTNPDAMKLYTTAGFQITSAQDYYKYLS